MGKNEAWVYKQKLLVVDDSGVALRTLKSLLEDEYEVTLVKSGEKALAKALEEVPDLILLDYDMPGWDGKKTLEELRAHTQTQDVPVIFLTGVTDKAQIVDVLQLGPQGYLLKPFQQDKLLEAIHKALGEDEEF